MKGSVLAGALLVVLGALALAYQGITYTKQKKVLDLGPIQATTKTEKHVPLPPVLGAAAIVVGALLLVAGGKQN